MHSSLLTHSGQFSWRSDPKNASLAHSPAARVSGSGLHACDALAAAMRSLVSGVRILFAGTLLVFQAGVLPFSRLQCRFGFCSGVESSGNVFLHNLDSL